MYDRERYRPKYQPRRRGYYWIVANENGKVYLVTGGSTEEEARQKGLEMLGSNDFDIRYFPTTNSARASQMLKGNRLERTGSLRTASQRLGHEKSIDRLRNRIDRMRRYS